MSKLKQPLTLLSLAFLLLILWFLPHSPSIDDKAWHLFSVFTVTILGIILQPLPMGAMAVLGIAVLLLTRTLTLKQGLSGFQDPIVWLVFFSFSIAKGIIKTRLGERIAYFFVSILGRSPLGLAYGITITDFLLAPAIPSVTARAGGIVYPVITSLSESFGSSKEKGTERLIGSFLITVGYQSSVISSAMFLTAMAGNPVLAGLTKHVGITLSWALWAKAAIIPGILSLLAMPLIVYKLFPPTIPSTKEAVQNAKTHLKAMGSLQRGEIMVLIVFSILVFLWIFGDTLRIPATTTALLGVLLLVMFNILDWHKDVVANTVAWETFIWFASLMMMALFLNEFGFFTFIGSSVVQAVSGVSWKIGFPILFFIYFYSHYFFASNTAHILAMFPVFLSVAISLGTQPIFAVLVFAFASNLFGGLTHYGSGPAPVYFGSQLISVKQWWQSGFLLSLVNIAIWVGVGSLWWKVLGLLH